MPKTTKTIVHQSIRGIQLLYSGVNNAITTKNTAYNPATIKAAPNAFVLK